MKKQVVLDLVNQFPDDVDAEKLMDELYLRVKLEKAEQSIEDDRTISQEEVVQRSRQWRV